MVTPKDFIKFNMVGKYSHNLGKSQPINRIKKSLEILEYKPIDGTLKSDTK